ncbi:hypothetical protein Hanom_Chr06g00552231 [Helianthus anomalus]
MKDEGLLLKTYDTLTGYENSCNLPSCDINFAVVTDVDSHELQIPMGGGGGGVRLDRVEWSVV